MISSINLKIVGYLFSAIFLYLAFKETDIKTIIQYLEYTNFLYIFISFFLITFFYLIRSIYQQNNIKYLSSEVTFSVSLQSITIAYFFRANWSHKIYTYFFFIILFNHRFSFDI